MLGAATSSVRRVGALCTLAGRCVHTEARIAQMGLTLPEPSSPKGSYISCTPLGDTVIMTAGHLPFDPSTGELMTGKVGDDCTVEDGAKAASHVALGLLSTLKKELGDLDRIKRVVKLVGFVNCVDGFAQQPQVINGASDLIGEILQERGVHARSAVGTNALPLNVPVEIEAIIEIEK